MRATSVIALSVAGAVASAASARAADLSTGHPLAGPVYGWPAAPLVIYDIDPGVTMRAYWEEPWANRHYFPATGKMPKYGRREVLVPHRNLPRAESFSRSWSSSSGYVEAWPAPPPMSRHWAPPAPVPLPPAKPEE
jgi:hypothetical protein